ncbi:MAG: hypothetical protein GY835_26555 [bacterium]|nr:hypothetical protein [bacterium]
MIVRSLIFAVPVVLINILFGMLRVRCRRFSIRWFLAIHAPVPFVFLLRRHLELPEIFILLSLTSAIIGQVAGGKLLPAKRGCS